MGRYQKKRKKDEKSNKMKKNQDLVNPSFFFFPHISDLTGHPFHCNTSDLCVSLLPQLQKAIEGSTRSGVRLRPPLASFRDASRKAKKHQPPSSTPSSPTRDRDLWGEGSRREGEPARRESKEDSRGKVSASRGTPGCSSAPSSPSSLGDTSGCTATTRTEGPPQEPESPSSSSPPASSVSPSTPVLTLSSLQEERESEESDEPI